MGKFAIVAKCDAYNARCHYNGQRVLKYDGATPIHWVQEEFDTYEEAKDAIYKQALGEYGAIEKDYEFVLSEVRNTDDLSDIKNLIEDWEDWGEGVYINDAFVMSPNDDSYTLDTMTYAVEELPVAKKAYLVTASVCTRVVLPEGATDEEIMDVAKERLLSNLNADYYDNVENIVEDFECPYGTLPADFKN